MKPAGVKAIAGVGFQVIPLNERQWSDTGTRALISAYKNHLDLFSNHLYKVRDVWKMVSDELKGKGIEKSGIECDKKFRNLQVAFKKVYYDTERTESSKYQWDLYADLLDVMTSDKVLRRSKPVVGITEQNAGNNCLYQVQIEDVDDHDSDSKGVTVHKITLDEYHSNSDDPDVLASLQEDLISNSQEEEESQPTKHQPTSKRKAPDQMTTTNIKRVMLVQPGTTTTEAGQQICILEGDGDFDYELIDVPKESNSHIEIFSSPSKASFASVQGDSQKDEFENFLDVPPEVVPTVDKNKSEEEEENEAEAPFWFQSFLISYETHTKMFQDKLNKIQETQELQVTRLQHLTNKIQKIEKQLNERKHYYFFLFLFFQILSFN